MTVEKPQLKRWWRIRSGERQLFLIAGDLIASYLALFVGLYFWGQKDFLNFSWEFLGQRAPFWFFLLPLAWMLFLIEIYDVRKANRKSDVFRGVGTAAIISFVLYMVIFFLSAPNSLPRRGVFIFILVAIALTIVWRLIYIRIFTAPAFIRRVMMIGAGNAGSTLVSMLDTAHSMPFVLVGYVDDDPKKIGKDINGYRVLGNGSQLAELIEKYNISDLIFAISGQLEPDLMKAVLDAEESGTEVTSFPTFYEDIFGRVPIFLLQSDWILRTFIDQSHTTGLYESIKRLIDIIGGSLGFFLLIALFPLISLLILVDSGFPIIYSQMRVGKNGRPYKIFKFRTMVKDAEKDGVARTATIDDSRITRFGKVLRRSHLDELPQVLNILRGENSIVGPRAEQIELVNQFQQEIPFYRARLLVRPGLTGWAQVNQRYATTVQDTAIKLEYDLYYIKKRNLLLDFNIILRTVGAVLGFKGL